MMQMMTPEGVLFIPNINPQKTPVWVKPSKSPRINIEVSRQRHYGKINVFDQFEFVNDTPTYTYNTGG